MPDNGQTIVATFGGDTKPLKDATDDIEKHVSRFGDNFKRIFGREPVPERRAAHALTELTRGFVGSSDAAEGFATVTQGLMSSLKLAAPASLGIAVLGTALIKAAMASRETKKEVGDLERETHKLVRTADFSTSAEGVESLTEKFGGLRKEQRKVVDELSQFSYARHPFHAVIKHLGEQLSGREPTFTPFWNRGASESEIKLGIAREQSHSRQLELTKKIGIAANTELEVTKAVTTQDATAGAILQERLKTEARIAELRKKEVSEGTINQVQQASDLRIKALQAEETASIRDEQTQKRIAGVNADMASGQLEFARLKVSSLTTDEKALAIGREQVFVAKEKELSAQIELEAAQQAANETEGISRAEKERRSARLDAARARATEARTGAVEAAGGLAETQGGVLEHRIAEAALGPAGQAAQYAQRRQEYISARQAMERMGMNPNILTPPRMGEVEYDKLRDYKAQQAATEAEGAGAGLTLREKLQSGMFDTGGSPQENIEANRKRFNEFYSSPEWQQGQEQAKLLNYPGMATTPRINVPLVPPAAPAAPEPPVQSGVLPQPIPTPLPPPMPTPLPDQATAGAGAGNQGAVAILGNILSIIQQAWA